MSFQSLHGLRESDANIAIQISINTWDRKVQSGCAFISNKMQGLMGPKYALCSISIASGARGYSHDFIV